MATESRPRRIFGITSSMNPMGEDWKLAFHGGPRARGIPVRGTFATRQEAERKRVDLQADLTETQKAQGGHFTVLEPPRSAPSSMGACRRKTRSLGDKRPVVRKKALQGGAGRRAID